MTFTLNINRTDFNAVATYSEVTVYQGSVCVYRAHGIESTPHAMAAGTYTAKRTMSKRFGKITWEILGVMDGDRLRTGLRVHAANFAADLLGCLAPGMGTADINNDGIIDVTASRRAIELFEQACAKAEELIVNITNPPAIT